MGCSVLAWDFDWDFYVEVYSSTGLGVRVVLEYTQFMKLSSKKDTYSSFSPKVNNVDFVPLLDNNVDFYPTITSIVT